MISTFITSLTRTLHHFEQEDTSEIRANFVTAINIVLVWSGARTATLPSWEYCDPNRVVCFIYYLNKLSQQMSTNARTVDELIILTRPQLYRTGTIVEQKLITLRNCPNVRMMTEPSVEDSEIGRELDMYHVNADYFAKAEFVEDAFSVWEAGTDALMYAEIWSPDSLSSSQLQEFLKHCEKRIALWNSAMERMKLPYRFYGTMDWTRSEIPFHKAVRTKKLFGKEFLGVDCRGSVLY
jgi:hypothetical protein